MKKHNKYQLESSSSVGVIVAISLVILFVTFGVVYPLAMVQAGDFKTEFEKLQINSRVEVELEFVADSILRAEAIEPAPKDGKDKLRGHVTSLQGSTNNWIEVMGIKVKFSEETVSDLSKSLPTSDDFKLGQRVYVKGRPYGNYLKAKEVMTKRLKESNKVTGTITEKIWQNKELFWIVILEKKIKVDRKTDITRQ